MGWHRQSDRMKRILEALRNIEEPNRSKCYQLAYENKTLFEKASGSKYNHQAWQGGYIDHVAGTMEICKMLYPSFLDKGVPFMLEDALLVMFLHDIEKPWIVGSWDKDERKEFRARKLNEYGITLTPEQENALKYVEGEGRDYSNKHRVMNELAAFCHIADVASSRIWWDRKGLS